MIGFELSKEQNKLVKEIRGLVQGEIAPRSLEMDRRGDESFDWSLVNILARHNLTCPIIPQKFGGLGLNYLTTALVLEEIAKGCAGLSAVINTNMHAVSPILAVSSSNQQETFLPIMAGTKPGLASFALTEPNAGSDVSSISTLAEIDNNGYLIHGVKDYVLNASVASFFVIFTTISPFQGRASLRAFIVPSSTPGLSIGRTRRKAGIRYSNTSEVILNHVRITNDGVLGGDSSGSGYLILTQALDRGRALVGAASVGIAQAAYELTLNMRVPEYNLENLLLNTKQLLLNWQIWQQKLSRPAS
jgi:alkylation response protein AidB-like acyl-CoA dehydrogenase